MRTCQGAQGFSVSPSLTLKAAISTATMCCAVLCCARCMQALPPAVCKLSSLERLSVDTCMHITQLPDCLTQMSSLTELALHNGEVGRRANTLLCRKVQQLLAAIRARHGAARCSNSLRESASRYSEVQQAVQHASDMCVRFRSSASPSCRGHCLVTALLCNAVSIETVVDALRGTCAGVAGAAARPAQWHWSPSKVAKDPNDLVTPAR